MSLTGQSRGATALTAILDMRGKFDRINDKDFDGVVIVLAKKQMIAAGQTLDDMKSLREVIGDDLFDGTLKNLSAYHVKLLAKRLDKGVDPMEISTGRMATDHVRKLMSGDTTPAPQPDKPEPTPSDDKPKNAYFGRRSFRAGN